MVGVTMASNENVSPTTTTQPFPALQDAVTPQNTTTEEAPMELSKLIGPKLNMPVQSALQMLRGSFEKFADNIALVSMFQPANHLASLFAGADVPAAADGDKSRDYLRWTFAQLKQAGELLAIALAERGVKEGSTIAAALHGSVEFYLIFYASLVLRCRFAPLNFHSVSIADEIKSMLKTVNASVVFAQNDEDMQLICKNAPDMKDDAVLRFVVDNPKALPVNGNGNGHVNGEGNGTQSASAEYFQDIIVGASTKGSKSSLDRYESIETSPDDDVVVIFTSGTSSLPKACPLTNSILTSIATIYGRGPLSGPTAVTCNHLPIYHIAGVISGGWNSLANGGRLVHPAPSFSSKSTLDAIRYEGVTFMVLVPSMIGFLVNDPDLPPPHEIGIKFISLGASTILYTDVEKCYEIFGTQRVITSYGMTEGLMMTRGHLPREPTEAAINGVQTIVVGSRLKICAPNSNDPLPRGEAGEVHQGGASTIRGYIGKQSDNFYTDEDGAWCKTGDQAVMHEDGGIQITGRYKDLVIRGGVNISPTAIEGFISRILGLEAHVVGMPDSIAGEVPIAVVRDADLGKATPQSLRSRIIKELGPRFALEKFISLSELGLKDFPITSTGKIRKVDLQAAVRKYAQKQAASEQVVAGAQGSAGSTIERLMDIWSEIAGVDRNDLTPKTSIRFMADSLTKARYVTQVRTKFGRPFTLADLEKVEDLEEQAALLDERGEESSATVDLYSDRQGPPTGWEMSHVGDDDEAAAFTKQICEERLIPMGFTWEDVQDVVTPSQWLQSWVKTRETSDRFRAAYVSTNADVATFTDALTDALHRNDSLRAVSIQAGDGSDLQIILRHSAKWLSKVIVIRNEPVATLKDLENLIPGDTKLNHGLAKVVVAHVEETKSAGCCLMTLHSTFDAFSLNILRNDLNQLLNKKKPKLHVPYKLWADHLHNTIGSAMASSSVKYNVRRLKGLASKHAALWPPQRAPVWQRGCDRGLHVTADGVMTSPDSPDQRPLLDGAPESCTGSDGIRTAIGMPDLDSLTTDLGVPLPIIVKAALVLLETRLTGQSDALFTQTFSMRDNWPFMDEWMSRRLPSPLEITGPTLARVAEIVPVDQGRNIGDWLKELKAEQDVLIKHCHAPYRLVFDGLNAQSEKANLAGSASAVKTQQAQISTAISAPHLTLPMTPAAAPTPSSSPPTTPQPTQSAFKIPPPPFTNTAELTLDGQTMESIRRRINFQWLPTFPSDRKLPLKVKMSSSSHFNEVGLAVKAGLMEEAPGATGVRKVWLKMEWDDGNIRREEAASWVKEMAGYINVLGRVETWGKSLGEVYVKA